MWPGDINDNGVVNAVDLLYLGVAYGSAGPARAGATTDWTPQNVTTPWGQTFPDGIDYAFADCDGNGFIDIDDLDDAIEDNFGLTHGVLLPDGFANAAPGTAPKLELIPSATLVGEGAILDIALVLGTEDFPVSAFYGIAIKFSFSTGLLDDDDGLEFETNTGSWINPDGSQLLQIYEEDENSGTGQFAITRTNQESVTGGNGQIGTWSIVVEDIIVGLSVDTFRLTIDSILLVTKEMNVLPVVPDTAEIIIARDTSLVTTSVPAPTEEAPLSVFPNPNSGTFLLISSRPIRRITLLDSYGRPAPCRITSLHERQYRVQAPGLPAGLYCLTAEIDGRIHSQKIFFKP